ncbi:hypothetical protein F4779DRAFT_185160 [Xylariaceae sp. FL0662B]|nr:hypothetical protein F4779DRAFT_185160 [Xylariaceae sp. FL0662B]
MRTSFHLRRPRARRGRNIAFTSVRLAAYCVALGSQTPRIPAGWYRSIYHTTVEILSRLVEQTSATATHPGMGRSNHEAPGLRNPAISALSLTNTGPLLAIRYTYTICTTPNIAERSALWGHRSRAGFPAGILGRSKSSYLVLGHRAHAHDATQPKTPGLSHQKAILLSFLLSFVIFVTFEASLRPSQHPPSPISSTLSL